MQSETDWANAVCKDVREMKAGDQVVVDRHREEGRYEAGVITGISPPGWVYYRPIGLDTIKATDPSNVRMRADNANEKVALELMNMRMNNGTKRDDLLYEAASFLKRKGYLVPAPSPPAGGGEPVRRVRHKNRGSTYRVLHGALMQSTHWHDIHFKEPVDGWTVVVYQSESDGSVWVRPATEFEDGRFEDIEPAPPSPDAAQQRIRELEEALARAQVWHESEDKALSKSGRSDADYHWRRLQHREQLDGIRASLPEASYSAAWDRINARTAGGSADE